MEVTECRGCAPGSGRYYPRNCCRVRLLKAMPTDSHRRGWMERWKKRLSAAEWTDLLAAVRRAFPGRTP